MLSADGDTYVLERRRYGVLTALWFANFAFWLAWFVQGPLLVSYWVHDRHVSFGTAEYLLSGVDITSIFTAIYIGYLHDRIGPRRVTTWCLLVIAIGFGLRPFVLNSFGLTLALTVVGGLGLPIVTAPPSIISRWFGLKNMTFPLMVVLSSFVCGQAAGLLLGARMVEAVGARWAFGSISILLVIALLMWVVMVPEGPAAPAGPTPARPAPIRVALRLVLTARGSWVIVSVGAIYAAVVVFAGSFLPGVLASSLRITPAQGGDAAAIVPATATIGVFVFGYLARNGKKLKGLGITTGVLQCFGWLIFTAAWFTHHLSGVVALTTLAVVGLCHQACFTLGLNAITRNIGIGAEALGVAAGVYFTGANLGGYVLPSVLAHIVDAVGPKAGFIGVAIMFVCGLALWFWVPRQAAPSQGGQDGGESPFPKAGQLSRGPA